MYNGCCFFKEKVNSSSNIVVFLNFKSFLLKSPLRDPFFFKISLTSESTSFLNTDMNEAIISLSTEYLKELSNDLIQALRFLSIASAGTSYANLFLLNSLTKSMN